MAIDYLIDNFIYFVRINTAHWRLRKYENCKLYLQKSCHCIASPFIASCGHANDLINVLVKRREAEMMEVTIRVLAAFDETISPKILVLTDETRDTLSRWSCPLKIIMLLSPANGFIPIPFVSTRDGRSEPRGRRNHWWESDREIPRVSRFLNTIFRWRRRDIITMVSGETPDRNARSFQRVGIWRRIEKASFSLIPGASGREVRFSPRAWY